MALERTFQELSDRLRRLQDSLLALQLTIREDLPPQGGVALVDQFGDAVDDSLGWMEESLLAAVEAYHAVEHPLDMDRARRALANCQEQFHRVEQRFASDLISYEKLKDLTSFGRSRRGEWIGWVRSVREGLRECQVPMDEVSKALLACWQEIAERAGLTSVSVQATNIGQQITAPELMSKDLLREGIT
jgi:hypothetical protein